MGREIGDAGGEDRGEMRVEEMRCKGRATKGRKGSSIKMKYTRQGGIERQSKYDSNYEVDLGKGTNNAEVSYS